MLRGNLLVQWGRPRSTSTSHESGWWLAKGTRRTHFCSTRITGLHQSSRKDHRPLDSIPLVQRRSATSSPSSSQAGSGSRPAAEHWRRSPRMEARSAAIALLTESSFIPVPSASTTRGSPHSPGRSTTSYEAQRCQSAGTGPVSPQLGEKLPIRDPLVCMVLSHQAKRT